MISINFLGFLSNRFNVKIQNANYKKQLEGNPANVDAQLTVLIFIVFTVMCIWNIKIS